MADPGNGLDVVDLVSRALRASHESAGALVVPTILLDRTQLGEEGQRLRGAQLADLVLGWFMRHGFHGERSRVGGHGYGDIIKNMQDWYRDTIATLRDQFEYRLSERDKAGVPYTDALRDFERTLFEEKLVLRQIMTEEQCDACYDTIFLSYSDEDGIEIVDYAGERAGAPDLLVWHSDPSRKLWFFCEVKSHNDHLNQAQHDWIQGSWHQIDGRFLLLLLGP
jgi:VRR-NUC domain